MAGGWLPIPYLHYHDGRRSRDGAGALRELHWHPNAAEWQYILSGQFNVTPVWLARTLARGELNQGDVAYIPQGFGHSIENVGNDKARILIVFNNGHYQTIDLSQWIAGNPTDVLATNFCQDRFGLREVPAQGRVSDEVSAGNQREQKVKQWGAHSFLRLE